MSKSIFISELALKDASLINDNVDMKVLAPVIKYCQEFYLIPALGSELYNDIDSAIAANTVSADYKTLLDEYVQPALMWWVMVEAPISLSYRYSSVGIEQKQNDNSIKPSMNELEKLSERNRKKAEWYTERITLYLVAHSAQYPKYLESSNVAIDTVRPELNEWQSGLNLWPDSPKTRPSFEDMYQSTSGAPFL